MSGSDESYQPDKELDINAPGDTTVFPKAAQSAITYNLPVTHTRKTNNSKAVELDAEQGDINLV